MTPRHFSRSRFARRRQHAPPPPRRFTCTDGAGLHVAFTVDRPVALDIHETPGALWVRVRRAMDGQVTVNGVPAKRGQAVPHGLRGAVAFGSPDPTRAA